MSITNATIAQQISDLIGYWDGFNTEYRDWLGGSAVGGPNSDGQYPLTDYQGVTDLVDSPAKLADSVSNNVSGALAHKDAALAAQVAAEAALTSAQAAETNAETAEAGSVGARDTAVAAQAAAESARSTAIAQAAVSSSNAAQTTADAAATAADAVSTAADAASAAASAAAAATFNPSLYALLDAPNFTGQLDVSSTGSQIRIIDTDEGGDFGLLERNGGAFNYYFNDGAWHNYFRIADTGAVSFPAATSVAIPEASVTDHESAIGRESSAVSTVVRRDSSGDINVRLIRSQYDTTNSNVGYVMTQINTGTNNYIRPTTPAQFRASVTDASYLGISAQAVDSAKLSGLSLKDPLNAPAGQQVIRSDTNGYTYLGWINTPSGSTALTPTRIYTNNGGSDQFVRYMTPANFRTAVTTPYYLSTTDNDTFVGKLSVGSTSSRAAGMYGTYDSTKTAHIWSMGTAYVISNAGTDFGNLYGLAYKHTNNPTGGTMAAGHQAVWCQNGTPTAALGSNIWTSGKVFPGGNGTGYIDNPTLRGSINVFGAQAGSYSGYSIENEVMLMKSGTICGIFDEVQDDWRIRFDTNKAYLSLYNSNVEVARTHANGLIRFSQGSFLHHASASHTSGRITVSTSDPSGGANGDIHFKV